MTALTKCENDAYTRLIIPAVQASTPSSSFLGKMLIRKQHHGGSCRLNRFFRVMAVKHLDESKQTDLDRWKGLAYDISDDQQDITRGKGLVDSLFEAPTGDGTHETVLSSYEYRASGSQYIILRVLYSVSEVFRSYLEVSKFSSYYFLLCD
jgi:hypothetical protein